MNTPYNEIINKLEKAELTIKEVKEMLSIKEDTKIIKTQNEFDNIIADVAKFLSTSDTYSSIQTTKHRLMNLKKTPNVKEAYTIQDKFGIPIYAWKDISWYRKNLTHKK